jgi:hypothetical protein
MRKDGCSTTREAKKRVICKLSYKGDWEIRVKGRGGNGVCGCESEF